MEKLYSKELQIATLAVHRASILTKSLFTAVDKGSTDKSDLSPVTIGDFAAQALIISAIRQHFPGDAFVAEESSTALRNNPDLLSRVWELVSSPWQEDGSEQLLAVPKTKEEMLDVIDIGGKGSGGSLARLWIIDPIDGTATFLKGHQYAVCLALIENGVQKVGVLGCPSLRLDGNQVREDLIDKTGYGLMLSAVEHQGTSIRTMSRDGVEPPRKLHNTENLAESRDFRWVESTKSSAITPETQRMVAQALQSSWPGTDLWSMQMKYVAMAVGGCNLMVRIPAKVGYRAFVWDHAGGNLIFQETGGKVTDIEGKPLDFGAGRQLKNNYGFVATISNVHSLVLETVTQVVKDTRII